MEDRSICLFYLKIGACRHGEKCARKHIRPQELKTVLLANLYPNPKTDRNSDISDSNESFEHFYTDVYKRLAQAGEIDSMLVCENENFHLSGNVYVKYTSTVAAQQAVMLINQEWFAGKPVYCELLPVQSFHDAKCRSHDTNTCNRGDHCNFMHIKKLNSEVGRRLRLAQDKSIAIKRLRKLFEDETWGEVYLEPSKEKYSRNKKPKVDKEAEKLVEEEKNGVKDEEKNGSKEESESKEAEKTSETIETESKEEEEQEEVSTTEAVARLFS